MAVRYVLAPEAALDVFEICDYVRERASREIADRVESVIREKIAFLATNSEIGHFRQDITTEEVKFFAVYSYLIVYRPRTAPLQIAAILHARRDVEKILKERL